MDSESANSEQYNSDFRRERFSRQLVDLRRLLGLFYTSPDIKVYLDNDMEDVLNISYYDTLQIQTVQDPEDPRQYLHIIDHLTSRKKRNSIGNRIIFEVAEGKVKLREVGLGIYYRKDISGENPIPTWTPITNHKGETVLTKKGQVLVLEQGNLLTNKSSNHTKTHELLAQTLSGLRQLINITE